MTYLVINTGQEFSSLPRLVGCENLRESAQDLFTVYLLQGSVLTVPKFMCPVFSALEAMIYTKVSGSLEFHVQTLSL